MKTRRRTAFDLSTVLSITTGLALPPCDLQTLQQALRVLLGVPVFTHQVPDALDVAGCWVLENHPQLVGVRPSDEERLSWATDDRRANAWVAAQRVTFGDTLTLTPVPSARISPQFADPLGSFQAVVGKDRVQVIVVPDAQEGEKR